MPCLQVEPGRVRPRVVLAAYDFDILILTGQPALYAGLAGGGPFIELPQA